MTTNVSADRHKPNRFSSYEETHRTVLQQFIDRDFVKEENLTFHPLLKKIRLSGFIACRGELLVSVDKMLNILDWTDDDAWIQTQWYAYNVSVQGWGNLFRYDNQDFDFIRPGHQDEHHKHIFDWRMQSENYNSPIWVGYQNWPTLGDVLFELEHWYWTNRALLPRPDQYAFIEQTRGGLGSAFSPKGDLNL